MEFNKVVILNIWKAEEIFSMETAKNTVIIIGAGLAGLTAAD